MIEIVSKAHAADDGGIGGDAGMINIQFLVGFIANFYLLLIRPQNKRRKEHQTLVSGLAKGDEIVTAGGIVGKVNKVEDDFVMLQVGADVEMRLQKTALGATLPKGTIKSLDES